MSAESVSKSPPNRTMMCPTCKTQRLDIAELAPGLSVHTCPNCRGNFIAFQKYLEWQATQPPVSTPMSVGVLGATAPEQMGPKFCAFCGRFMTRFRIALDIPFHIDRCGGCGGIWLEAGEWEELGKRALQTRVNTLFNDTWQNQLRQEEARRNQEERYRSLLGDADYKTAQEFKRWLEQHPKRTTIWALLENKNLP